MYVRDDRPFAGQAPPAALLHYLRDRKGEDAERHLAGFTGWLQADAFAGHNRLYEPDRRPGPIHAALCWAHALRGFFKLADIAANRRPAAEPPARTAALELEASLTPAATGCLPLIGSPASPDEPDRPNPSFNLPQRGSLMSATASTA